MSRRCHKNQDACMMSECNYNEIKIIDTKKERILHRNGNDNDTMINDKCLMILKCRVDRIDFWKI